MSFGNNRRFINVLSAASTIGGGPHRYAVCLRQVGKSASTWSVTNPRSPAQPVSSPSWESTGW